jgi:hypothetical protein
VEEELPEGVALSAVGEDEQNGEGGMLFANAGSEVNGFNTEGLDIDDPELEVGAIEEEGISAIGGGASEDRESGVLKEGAGEGAEASVVAQENDLKRRVEKTKVVGADCGLWISESAF